MLIGDNGIVDGITYDAVDCSVTPVSTPTAPAGWM